MSVFFPEIKILSDYAVLPQIATSGSAGHDLFLPTDTPEQITIYPGEVKSFCLGFAIDLVDPNLVMLMFPRSGTGTQGLHLANVCGIIDSDYQGEVILKLKNDSDDLLCINSKKAVAQALFVPCFQMRATCVKEFSRDTERGAGGFGSTDTKTN